MKIALIGASGSAGSRILLEALARAHVVTAIARHAQTLTPRDRMTAVDADINDVQALTAALRGHDAVVSSVRFLDFDAGKLLRAMKSAGVGRLVMVGGAGSLLTPSGVALVDTPGFPPPALPEARAGAATLAALREETGIDWTFVSPSAQFGPGTRTGKFRIGADQLLVAPDGKSHVSQEDFAIALLDELESGAHPRQRITVGD